MEITKAMYQLAKKIVAEYENKPKDKAPALAKNTILKRKLVFIRLANKVNDTELTVPLNFKMLEDFMEYWTEHGPKDIKMRFEKERSFSMSRRLKTWLKNSTKWNKWEAPKTLTEKMEDDYGISS